MSVTERLEFELAYYNVTVQYIIHYSTENPPTKLMRIILSLSLSLYIYILIYIYIEREREMKVSSVFCGQ